MSATPEQASVEVRIDREDTVSRHHNRGHFEKLNFWRDILPGARSLKLPESDGDWVDETLVRAEITPCFQLGLVS